MEILQPGIKPQADEAKDVEKLEYCDDQGLGVKVKFWRHFIYNADGTFDSSYDTDFDGVAYVVSGTATPCDAKVSEVSTGRESITIDDTAAVSLTVPANSKYAIIQVIGVETLYYTIDGATTPLANGTLGFLQNDCAMFKIGCDPDSGGLETALADLEAIAATGSSGRLEVQYFGCA